MAQQGTGGGCRVSVANTGASFVCPPGELILDAALAAGVRLPHNCRGGACGTCKAEIVDGEVDHGWVMSFAITEAEKAAGKCLICQSRPLSPTLTLRVSRELLAPDDAKLPAPIEASGVVLASEPVTPFIRRLAIALPRGVAFRFRAGQHVEIRSEGVRKPRTYSIASAPDDQGLAPDGLLEVFVTRHEAGKASGWLHAPERLGAAIAIHGPYGTFHLPARADGPVLALAGGSGLSPILSIARRALASGFAQPLCVILSARDRSEVFALDALHALARRHGNFAYLVTLTRAESLELAAGWRVGRIPTWLDREFPDLSGHWLLVAGAPGFVDGCIDKARALGAAPERILTDSFTPTAG